MATITPELFALIDLFCSGEQISNLLRSYRDTEGIKITAATKETLIKVNLATAIESRVVAIEKVYDLIREAEENGSQHIFFYRPAGIPKPLTVAEIGERLWGEGWAKKMKFPRVALLAGKFI